MVDVAGRASSPHKRSISTTAIAQPWRSHLIAMASNLNALCIFMLCFKFARVCRSLPIIDVLLFFLCQSHRSNPSSKACQGTQQHAGPSRLEHQRKDLPSARGQPSVREKDVDVLHLDRLVPQGGPLGLHSPKRSARTLLGAPGIATRSKDATRGSSQEESN